MELIKRVEMITGPGGVLWGSNSLLGILNVITKDAEDVDGVEVGGHARRRQRRSHDGARLRDGRRARPAGGKLKLFAHASVETYQGPTFEMPLLLFHDRAAAAELGQPLRPADRRPTSRSR